MLSRKKNKHRISVEIFVEWLVNKNPPWTAYRVFVFVRLVALEKQPIVILVVIGETWRLIFAKCVLKVFGT